MAVSDLTGTKWYFNEVLGGDNNNIGGEIYYTSNNKQYVGISFTTTLTYGPIDYPSSPLEIVWAYNGGWTDQAYRTIEITGGTDATTNALIQWLQANATQIVEPTTTDKISIGTLNLASAFIGSSELASMWLGNVKLWEKSTPAPDNALLDANGNYLTANGDYLTTTEVSGYSGNITIQIEGTGAIATCIKFDSAPISSNDYDFLCHGGVIVDSNYTEVASPTYANKTKVYVWTTTRGGIIINGVTTIVDGDSEGYDNATEVTLTGNYDIAMISGTSGGSDI